MKPINHIDILRSVLSKEKKICLICHGRSMEPTINHGDTIAVLYYDYELLEINDIIVFEFEEKLIAHRIIEIIYDHNSKKVFVTKGDYLKYKDTILVTKSRYFGIVGGENES